MRAVLNQALANLSNRRLQFVLILITLTSAAALLTLALTTLYSTQGAYQRLFKRTNGAHLWLILNPRLTTTGEVNQMLTDLPEVEGITPIMHTISGTLFVGETRLGGIHLREWPTTHMSIDEHIFIEGRKPNPGEKNVIVLDRDTANTYHAALGDTVYILTPTGRVPVTAIGLTLSSNICPAINCWPPVNYLSTNAFQDLGLSSLSEPKPGSYEVGLRLSNPNTLLDVLQKVETRFSVEAVSSWYSWEDLQATANGATRNIQILFLTFSIVAGLASVLLITNTINGAIRSQRRQIGLLKTIGFTNPQVRGIYLIESIVLSSVSGFLGLILGGLTSSLVLKSVAAIFGEELVFPPLWIIVAVPSCTVILAIVATILPPHQAERQSAVDAIRFGAERPRGRKTRFFHRSVIIMFGLSETINYPLRSALTGLGLGMAVLTLTAALILNNTFNSLASDPKLIGFDEDMYVHRTPYIVDEEIRYWLESNPEILAYYIERWGKFRFEGEEKVLQARFRDGDLSSFSFPIIEGRMFQGDDEALVGYGLVTEWGIKIGDEIQIVLEGQRMTFKVVGSYRENSNLGRMLVLPLNALRQVRPDVEIFSYTLKLTPDADPKAIAEKLITDTNYLTEVTIPFAGGLPADIVMSQKVMLGLSLIMSIIATVGVLSSLWTSVQERQREFGMLKAIGMTPREVSFSVIIGALGTALFGCMLGLPIGIISIRTLVDIVARKVGFGPLEAPIDLLSLSLILPIMALVSVIGALIPARRASRVGVVDMLRYE